MWNLKIGHVIKFQQKISPFEKFVAEYVFFKFFKILILNTYKKTNTNGK